MTASLVTWCCQACGAEGHGDMPPEHEAHRAPKPLELVAVRHPEFGWGLTVVPIEFLSPAQRKQLYWEAGWWCTGLP